MTRVQCLLFPVPDMSVTEPEINARLDSLCLSMTEHALGSFTDTLWYVVRTNGNSFNLLKSFSLVLLHLY